MLVGYARVSTQEQDLALQLDALTAAGCARVYEEKASGAQRERPELKAALGYMRQGDTLVVWKLLYSGKNGSAAHLWCPSITCELALFPRDQTSLRGRRVGRRIMG